MKACYLARHLQTQNQSAMISVNGKVIHKSSPHAILGNPWLALVELSKYLERRGEILPAGSIIFSGAITDAITLERENQYQMAIDGLGKIELDVH